MRVLFFGLRFNVDLDVDNYTECGLKIDVQVSVNPVTNTTVYDIMSTQLYLDNSKFFDVLENIVIMAIIPIFTFVVVVVATSVTVVQLKRVIVWRQRASASVDGTEVECYSCYVLLLQLLFGGCVVDNGGGSNRFYVSQASYPPDYLRLTLSCSSIFIFLH